MEPTMLEGVVVIVATVAMVMWPFHWPAVGLLLIVMLWLGSLVNLALAAQWQMFGATVLFTAAMLIASTSAGTCNVILRCRMVSAAMYRDKMEKIALCFLGFFICIFVPYLLIFIL